MPSDYLTIPIYLSGINEITGYTCPVAKKAIIKNITFANKSGSAATATVSWNETNSIGINRAGNTGVYELIVSGAVSGYNGLSTFNHFITIKAGDFITVQSDDAFQLNGFISLMEQDA